MTLPDYHTCAHEGCGEFGSNGFGDHKALIGKPSAIKWWCPKHKGEGESDWIKRQRGE